jgi:hypothetical protein
MGYEGYEGYEDTTLATFARFSMLADEAQKDLFNVMRTTARGLMALAGEPDDAVLLAVRTHQLIYMLDTRAEREDIEAQTGRPLPAENRVRDD